MQHAKRACRSNPSRLLPGSWISLGICSLQPAGPNVQSRAVYIVQWQGLTKAPQECREAKELWVGSVDMQTRHLAQKVRGHRAHAAHQTHQKVAHRRARDLAEVGLVPKWLERVALLCTGPVASTHPLSIMRHSKGSGRATYLAPTQDALAPGMGAVENHPVPRPVTRCVPRVSQGELWHVPDLWVKSPRRRRTPEF